MRSAMTDSRGYYCHRYRRFSRATASLIRLLQEETAAWWWREVINNHALQAVRSIHTNWIPYRLVFIPAVRCECKLPYMHLYKIPIHVRSHFRTTDSNRHETYHTNIMLHMLGSYHHMIAIRVDWVDSTANHAYMCTVLEKAASHNDQCLGWPCYQCQFPLTLSLVSERIFWVQSRAPSQP